MYSKDDIEVLIPTYNKKIEDVQLLLDNCNIETNCTISVQTNFDSMIFLPYNGKTVRVIFTTSKGVSANRNILLNALTSKIGLFLDDDCSLIDNYYEIILDVFNNGADCACFNGFSTSGKLISKNHSCQVKKFSKISALGGPGIAIKKEVVQKIDKFNECVGTPNYVFCGEDSLFLYKLTKNRLNFWFDERPLFSIINNYDNSSYFKGFTEQFFRSKGAINKIIYKKIFLVRVLKISLFYKLVKGVPLRFSIKNLLYGGKNLSKTIL